MFRRRGRFLMAMAPTPEELVRAHEKYTNTVPNNYVVTTERIANSLPERNTGKVADALAAWLKNINQQYYRFRPDEARNLRGELEPLIAAECKTLLEFRAHALSTLTRTDEPAVLRMFELFRSKLGPVGAAKALRVLAPAFFPLWDTATAYGVSTEHGYFQFMLLTKQQVASLPKDFAIRETSGLLKALDEYNYCKHTQGKKTG
jgi:hypothetical protein